MRGSPGLDAATLALGRIGGFSDAERAVIIGLLRMGHLRLGPGHEGWEPPLAGLVDCLFTWSEFDRWQAFFAAREAFPRGWESLQVIPMSPESPAGVMYRQRKLELLLEWLDMLRRRATEFGHYSRQGRRVRIMRQGDGHRCPVCDFFNAHEVTRGDDTMPPLHPGCRCVLMAATTPRTRSR